MASRNCLHCSFFQSVCLSFAFILLSSFPLQSLIFLPLSPSYPSPLKNIFPQIRWWHVLATVSETTPMNNMTQSPRRPPFLLEPPAAIPVPQGPQLTAHQEPFALSPSSCFLCAFARMLPLVRTVCCPLLAYLRDRYTSRTSLQVSRRKSELISSDSCMIFRSVDVP